MPIIHRYILLEVCKALIAIITILLLIFISFRLARFLGDAASGKIPSELIFYLVGLKLLENIKFLMPISLFIAIMLALGKFYRDSEMTAFFACGISLTKIAEIILIFAIPYSILIAWVTLSIAPKASEMADELKLEAIQQADFTGIHAGRFKEAQSGEIVFYIESLSADKKTMQNIFIQNRQHEKLGITTADEGHLEVDKKNGNRYLVLHNGYRYEGNPGTANYRVIEFKSYAVLLDTPKSFKKKNDYDTYPTTALMQSDSLAQQGELHWRLSLPICALILAIIAVPLSHTTPRQGRYLKLIFGLLIFVIYLNCLGIAKTWVEKGLLTSGWHIWWVHIFFLCFALFLFIKHNGLSWYFSANRKIQ